MIDKVLTGYRVCAVRDVTTAFMLVLPVVTMLPMVPREAFTARGQDPVARLILPPIMLSPRSEVQLPNTIVHTIEFWNDRRESVHASQEMEQPFLKEDSAGNAYGAVRDALGGTDEPVRRILETGAGQRSETRHTKHDDGRLRRGMCPSVTSDLHLRIDMESNAGQGTDGERVEGARSPDRDGVKDVQARVDQVR